MAVENLTVEVDNEGLGSYYKLSDAPIAYSVNLSELVVADYDANGGVRGIEFVGKQDASIETYLAEARKQPRQKSRPPRGSISGLAALPKSA